MLEYPDDETLAHLDELLDLDDGLSDWEVQFVESMNHRRTCRWSYKQIVTVNRIWEARVVRRGYGT